MTAIQDTLRRQWFKEGWIRQDGLLDADRTGEMRRICERVLAQWRLCSSETGEPGGFDSVNHFRHLIHPGYHRDRRDDLAALLETIADPRILEFVGAVFDDEVLFRCTSLFMNPLDGNLDGNWHRDTQFLIPDEHKEKAWILAMAGEGCYGMQLQITLVPNDDCEYVPKSHLRWDTPEEYAIRRADGEKNNRSNDMPGATRVALRPGDAVAFNPAGLHRGRYYADIYRRTLMLTYSAASRSAREDYFSHQPWFLELGYLDGLSDHARKFYDRFIDRFGDFLKEERDYTPS